MLRTRVKICGVRRPVDAVTAARAGADAIGIILDAKSSRAVDIPTARAIVEALPPYVTPVGLFVDQRAERIAEIARLLGIRHIQLHGSELPEVAVALSSLVIVKAIRADPLTLANDLAMWTTAGPNVRGIVLETPHTGRPGGSGIENNWAVVVEAIAAGLFKDLPIIAAGGLRPENVGEILRMIRPWAVDVSSGVEEVFGEKSTRRMNSFMHAVANADCS